MLPNNTFFFCHCQRVPRDERQSPDVQRTFKLLGAFHTLAGTLLISVGPMSWLKEMAGGEKMPPYVENDSSSPKVKDPYIPNRMVSNKPANRPFLAYAFTSLLSGYRMNSVLQLQGLPREAGSPACWMVEEKGGAWREGCTRRKSWASGAWPNCCTWGRSPRVAQIHSLSRLDHCCRR